LKQIRIVERLAQCAVAAALACTAAPGVAQPTPPALPGATAAGERPSIRVAVDIRSESLRRTLGTRRADAEQRLAAGLAELLQLRHPYLAWSAATATTVPAPAAATGASTGTTMGTLLATIVDRGTAAAGSPVALAWSLPLAGAAGGEQALKLPEVPIFPPFDIRASAHEPVAFAQHARERLRAVVQSEGFDRQSFEQLVSLLPIARGIEALADDRLVLIPLRWEHLRLGPGSRLEVQVVQTAADGERRNRAVLTAVQERRRGEPRQRGLVQATVAELFADSTAMPLDRQWHPRLPELLRGREVLCYLKHFQADEFGSAAAGPVLRLDP
jgi:hypothetical protein